MTRKSLVVAYDGKGGRMVKADILLDFWIATKIRLHEWGYSDKPLRTMWVWRRPKRVQWPISWRYLYHCYRWGRYGWLKGDGQLMRRMFGVPGDFYSVIGTLEEVQGWDLGHREIQDETKVSTDKAA